MKSCLDVNNKTQTLPQMHEAQNTFVTSLPTFWEVKEEGEEPCIESGDSETTSPSLISKQFFAHYISHKCPSGNVLVHGSNYVFLFTEAV